MADDRRARFRQALKDPSPLLMPGGFSPIMARMAQLVGFQAFYMSGSQTAAYVHGLPDVGLVTMRDMVDNARRVASVSEIPIFADADTGYGNAINVHHTVQEYVRAGVAGIHLEDQEAPKKSGTMAGRRCISREEAIGKIKAAVAAKREIDPEFVICARCDVIGAEGGSYEEAVGRSIAYAEEAEADMVWLNNVQTLQEAEDACRRIPCPVIPHWGGPPPAPSLEDWRNVGAAALLFPAMTTSVGLQAAWDFLNDFKERGMAAQEDWSQRARNAPWGPVGKHSAELLRGARIRDLEDQYLPRELQRDYESTFGHRSSLD